MCAAVITFEREKWARVFNTEHYNKKEKEKEKNKQNKKPHCTGRKKTENVILLAYKGRTRKKATPPVGETSQVPP